MTPIPDGIPQGLSVKVVCAALNESESRVKRLLRTQQLPSWRISPTRGWRLVRPIDLVKFAQDRGLEIDWDAVSRLAL